MKMLSQRIPPVIAFFDSKRWVFSPLIRLIVNVHFFSVEVRFITNGLPAFQTYKIALASKRLTNIMFYRM